MPGQVGSWWQRALSQALSIPIHHDHEHEMRLSRRDRGSPYSVVLFLHVNHPRVLATQMILANLARNLDPGIFSLFCLCSARGIYFFDVISVIGSGDLNSHRLQSTGPRAFKSRYRPTLSLHVVQHVYNIHVSAHPQVARPSLPPLRSSSPPSP